MNHTTLYVGVTSTLAARIVQHKEKFYPNSFSAKYNCIKLVYYKWFDTIIEAIAEEKRIKGGSRKKKEILINSINPEWKDLYDQIKFLYIASVISAINSIHQSFNGLAMTYASAC